MKDFLTTLGVFGGLLYFGMSLVLGGFNVFEWSSEARGLFVVWSVSGAVLINAVLGG